MSTFAPSFSQHSLRRGLTALVLGGLAAGAWSASVDAMNGTEMAGRFSVGSLGFFLGLWILMMAAMMFPSVWPAVAVYGLIVRRRASAHPARRSAVFVAGYLLAWTAVGLCAFGAVAAARAAGLDTHSDAELARFLVAPVAFVAAAYQFAPFKQACLRHCRGPLGFFLEHWRDGLYGALQMGARHGGYCVGCCWMLMLVLVSLGVMSLTWMAVVAVAIAVEKLAPAAWARVASGALAAGLAAVALVALAKPSWLPGVGGMDDGMSPTMR